LSANDFLGYALLDVGPDSAAKPEVLFTQQLLSLKKEEPVRGTYSSCIYRASIALAGVWFRVQLMIVTATSLIGMHDSALSDPYVEVDAGKNSCKTPRTSAKL